MQTKLSNFSKKKTTAAKKPPAKAPAKKTAAKAPAKKPPAKRKPLKEGTYIRENGEKSPKLSVDQRKGIGIWGVAYSSSTVHKGIEIKSTSRKYATHTDVSITYSAADKSQKKPEVKTPAKKAAPPVINTTKIVADANAHNDKVREFVKLCNKVIKLCKDSGQDNKARMFEKLREEVKSATINDKELKSAMLDEKTWKTLYSRRQSMLDNAKKTLAKAKNMRD